MVLVTEYMVGGDLYNVIGHDLDRTFSWYRRQGPPLLLQPQLCYWGLLCSELFLPQINTDSRSSGNGLDLPASSCWDACRGQQVALDVVRGVVHMHARKVVHLDLKSANILLARDGTAKIADVSTSFLLVHMHEHEAWHIVRGQLTILRAQPSG